MRKSWLVCVLLGALAWGQAQPTTPPAQAPAKANPAPAGNAAAKPEAAAPEEVSLTAAVLTVKGVSCPEFTKTPAGSSAAAGKTAASAKKPADCIITRAQFDKLTKALQQGPNPLNAQQKRTLATQLPG